MSLLAPWRRFALAVRFARRAAWSGVGQSILVVSLMVVPLTSVATFLTVVESQVPTAAESITMRMGQAEAELRVVSPPDPSLTQNPIDPETWRVETDSESGERLHSDRSDPRLTPEEALPEGTSILAIQDKGVLIVETATGIGAVRYVEGEVWNPALAGAFTLEAGRPPSANGEVLVTASTLGRLSRSLGDEFTSRDPAATFTIVGVIDEAMQSDAINIVYARPGTIPGAGPARYFLPDRELSWEDVQELNRNGIIAWSRSVLLNPPADAAYLYDGRQGTGAALALIIVFGVFEIAVLAGAAFLVGARRQQRTLALLSSTGAERSTLVQIITAGGLVLGFAAGVAGTALGVGVAWLYTRLIDTGDATVLPGFHIPWTMLVIAALLTAVIGWAAALVPAIVASKVDVMAALRGATRPAQPRLRSLRAGLILLAIGCSIGVASTIGLASTGWGFLADVSAAENALIVVLVVLIVAAAIIVAVGLLLLLGRVLGLLARATRTATLPLRLAARDLARNSARSVPIVAVILATVSIATFVMSIQSYQQALATTYRVLPAVAGQATIPLFSSTAYDGEPTPDRSQASAIADELTAVAQGRLDLHNIRTIQRPWQDWTAWGMDDDYTLVVPQRDPAQECPVDPATGRAADPQDPRCDFRNALIHLNSTGPGAPTVLIGDADDLALLAGTSITDEQRAALQRGDAIAFWPQLIDSRGEATLEWKRFASGGAGGSETVRTERLPATLIQAPERLAYGLFMTPATARNLGLDPVDALIVMDFRSEPDTGTLDAVNAELAAVYPGVPLVSVTHDPADEGQLFQWIALGLVLLATISAAAVAIGLGRIESRRAEFTLWSIGADPALARLISGLRTGAQTLLAVALGILIGLIPGYGIWGGPTTGIDMSPPWAQLVIMLTGLPLLFGLAATLMPLGVPRGTGARTQIP